MPRLVSDGGGSGREQLEDAVHATNLVRRHKRENPAGTDIFRRGNRTSPFDR